MRERSPPPPLVRPDARRPGLPPLAETIQPFQTRFRLTFCLLFPVRPAPAFPLVELALRRSAKASHPSITSLIKCRTRRSKTTATNRCSFGVHIFARPYAHAPRLTTLPFTRRRSSPCPPSSARQNTSAKRSRRGREASVPCCFSCTPADSPPESRDLGSPRLLFRPRRPPNDLHQSPPQVRRPLKTGPPPQPPLAGPA